MSRRVAGRAAGLGPNQIAWLRANLRSFDGAWKAVQASDAHAARVRSSLNMEHDEDKAAAAP